ncbi:MAG: hypothetical protein JKX72_07040 [Robiginitomaculum sp.]|nr:hypothetical protein [Robiginitomaculum sp.]
MTAGGETPNQKFYPRFPCAGYGQAMNLNYQEIMELPEPAHGVDVGTMESICEVYAQLVAKFTRLLEEARQIKVCWMQEERIAIYAKRLADNQRQYRCIERQRRAGEITNFCLLVREWVLSCPKRRLRLRALIGESRIAKWQDRRLAYKNRVGSPLAPTKHQVMGNKTARRYEVRNWYRLPSVSQHINTLRPKPPCVDMQHIRLHIRSVPKPVRKEIPLTPAAHGMCRAVPAVVFWPDELAPDYVHGSDKQQVPQEKPVWEHSARRTCETEKLLEYTGAKLSHMGATTAKEWPD